MCQRRAFTPEVNLLRVGSDAQVIGQELSSFSLWHDS